MDSNWSLVAVTWSSTSSSHAAMDPELYLIGFSTQLRVFSYHALGLRQKNSRILATRL